MKDLSALPLAFSAQAIFVASMRNQALLRRMNSGTILMEKQGLTLKKLEEMRPAHADPAESLSVAAVRNCFTSFPGITRANVYYNYSVS